MLHSVWLLSQAHMQGLLVIPPAPVASEAPAAQIPPSPFVASQEQPLESPFLSSSKSLTTSKSELDPSKMPLQSAVERSKTSLVRCCNALPCP